MTTTATWTFRLLLGNFETVEAEISGFLKDEGIEGRAAFVSRLVVEEIVRNLIEHTPPDAVDEEVTVGLAIVPDLVTVSIEDSRPPFAPGDAPELDVDAPLEERRTGGMGLHLVRSMTDDLTYERVGERNRLTACVSRT